MINVSPSVLSADFANLAEHLRTVEQADWLHLDIMDGHFVPNISFGIPVVGAIHSVTQLPLDVHLMIDNPDQYLVQFRDAGADMITVHAEACTHLHRTLSCIKELGCKAGVALNPHTSLDCLEHVLPLLDLVLIMTVNPGFGGQSFIQEMIPKIARLSNLLTESGLSHVHIGVDGGVNETTAQQVINAGATFLVAGSAVFKSHSPSTVISRLKNTRKDA